MVESIIRVRDQKREARRLGYGVLLVLAVTTLACIGSGTGSTLPVGEKAPDFGIRQEGGSLILSDLVGDVVIVNFWSST